MTQRVRDFVAWTIFCIETFFRSLFQVFLEPPPFIASFFLLYPIWASGSFVNMLLLCAFDSESWIVYFHQYLLSDTMESAVLLHAASVFEGISSLCSPSIGALPFFLDVSCILIYISCCLTVYSKEKRNDEKIDMKALSFNECIIMTLIMTWLFEKRNIIILGYSGVQSLISLKVCIQFWLTDYVEETLRWVFYEIRIAVSRIAMLISVVASIDSFIHRRSQIFIQSLCAACAMLRYATSHIGRRWFL